MTGKYELFVDHAGRFRFRLKASNGQVLAVSQGYTTRRAALEAIESVRKHASAARVVELDD